MSDVINAESILYKLQNIIKDNPNTFNTELSKLVLTAKPNDREKTTITKGKTEFPDFISENGIIEHFHITSGKISPAKNGRYRYDITTQEHKNNDEHNKFEESCRNTEFTNKEFSTSINRSNDNNSIDNFHKSFEKSFLHHLDSYSKYKNGKIHLFSILVSSDDVLTWSFAETENCNEEISDHFHKLNRESDLYEIIYDKTLLEYLQSYINIVDYVIYYNCFTDSFQILDLTLIPFILSELHSNKDYMFIFPNTICSIHHIEVAAQYKIPKKDVL